MPDTASRRFPVRSAIWCLARAAISPAASRPSVRDPLAAELSPFEPSERSSSDPSRLPRCLRFSAMSFLLAGPGTRRVQPREQVIFQGGELRLVDVAALERGLRLDHLPPDRRGVAPL